MKNVAHVPFTTTLSCAPHASKHGVVHVTASYSAYAPVVVPTVGAAHATPPTVIDIAVTSPKPRPMTVSVSPPSTLHAPLGPSQSASTVEKPTSVGALVGTAVVGVAVGAAVGNWVGCNVVGACVGAFVGALVGGVGAAVGSPATVGDLVVGAGGAKGRRKERARAVAKAVDEVHS